MQFLYKLLGLKKSEPDAEPPVTTENGGPLPRLRVGWVTDVGDEAAVHPQKNVLYRAVGQGGELEVDTYMRTIGDDVRLLLCSDGLWGIVTEAKMAKIVMTSSSPQTACERLVVAANEAGGRDNITAILVEPPASPGV